ncbi:dihydrolipoamide acetyltransferase family protein [Allobranchiibius sp. CTAmp26]|uniref:dihydrolipoamide acetyltransferase family protein n=1 Tax=Allobranchiibius sp. CTAmp26 TaxID=2815214 RepID=UPI001AA1B733|nr:dihydrolipoamide acetyltransferase family protein [Allobranchiibius sp. CTAmp26]MBO1754790.1 2-oxo acid dehydrogenase subunit E2 [Allobranchiibius sp. CTAmp26]
MAVQTFNLPDPGEGLVEADIVTWKVQVGDEVSTNDIVVEIETAKSLVELPIPWAGKVTQLLVEEGATVEVGSPIIAVEVAGAASSDPSEVTTPSAEEPEERTPHLVGYGAAPAPTARRARKGATAVPAAAPAPPAPVAAAPAPAPPAPAVAEVAARSMERATTPAAATGGKVLAKPPVRKFAKDHGVDLSSVAPSAESGIVSRADVECYLANGTVPSADSAPAAVRADAQERETRIPVKGVRKFTADAMVASAFTAPHVTEFVTIDVSATMELVDRLRSDREFAGLKVTPLTVLARALCVAVKRNPGINASWAQQADGSAEIVQKRYVNLGIAAATPRGLVVPNIKDADAMSMRELAEALGALTSTAREGRTPPGDMSGGTITITNVGVFGVDTGTPIINPGEAAILCFGAVRRMPWVVADADGTETIVPRHVTQLSLSFDHRMVDGDLGSRFLADVAALLQDPSRALVWG